MVKKSDKNVNVVLVGHVDHGKSTVLGRMLADADALPKGKLEQVKETCARNSKPFEYAFLIDALKDEQAQGITIDSARVFFKTEKRDYIIIDAPGHIEFLKNMVTGASRAEAAFLVIDASEGVRENSRRHGFLLAMLGIKQVVVVVNKMDLVKYDRKRFEDVVKEYKHFLSQVGMEAMDYIPASGLEGENITSLSEKTPWYRGRSVLEAFELFSPEEDPVDKPFRMPVQGVYKFTNFGDDRRIVAGDILTGKISVGDEVLFYPSGKKSTVKTIEGFNAPSRHSARAGWATGFTLNEQIYIKRGELAIKIGEEKPHVTTRLRASLFWLSREDMRMGKEYLLKLGTAKIPATLEKIEKIFDTSDLESDLEKASIEKNMFAECILKLKKPLAFDLVGDFQKTSRFVVVDNYNIAGGGIVRGSLKDEQSWIREKVLVRDYKWIKSGITQEERREKYAQESAIIFITGKKGEGRKTLARNLEKELFDEGKVVYYLGLGNVLYGVDADIKGVDDTREEHLRRLAEVSHIMLKAGVILIVTAIELTQEDVELIKTSIGDDKIEVIWVGGDVTTDVECDMKIGPGFEIKDAITKMRGLMKEKGIIDQ